MSRYDINSDLFDNIEIPNYIKRELYKDCKRGKRAADLRFRFAGPLTALIILGAVGLTGIGAKAGYETWVKRMETMPETEKAELFEEINNDTGITIDEAWSRKLTDVEIIKIAELENKYYNLNVYPENEVQRLEKLSDWDGKSVCYIEEDHLLHLPDTQMTEEQMLQFIDYTAKKDYLIENNADEIQAEDSEDEWTDEEYEDVPSPYVDVDSATEEDIIKVATPHLTKLLGWELGSEWKPRVEAFKPSTSYPEDKDHDMYSVIWEEGCATPNSTDYIVVLGMYDLNFRAAAVRGREHFATLKSYTGEAAATKGEADKTKVYKILKDM